MKINDTPKTGFYGISSKLTVRHLERQAIVYVRQSTPQQVLEHQESAALQYALVQKAASLGWTTERIVVIDDDQGQSAQSAAGRDGFQRLLAEVGLDHVGIVLGIEMSRLARSCKDWHHLLDLCSLFQTLLADQDGLYDPTNYNDRLLLGLKGTMSEAELHILHSRMCQGRWNKARRGELFNRVPTGYVRTQSGECIMDPDEQVQSIVRLIFDKFDELQSLNAVLQYFTRNNLRLAIRRHCGENRGNLEWHAPSRATLQNILRHPIYAGAYRYGHRPTDPRARITGRPGTGRKIRYAEDCEVFLRDRLPAYISWDRYVANHKKLADNRARAEAMGAPRQGPALLSGILICGICGCRMAVSYQGKTNRFRYSCLRDSIDYGKPPCQSFCGQSPDALVVGQVLEAIKPAALELSLKACENLQKEHNRLTQDWHQKLGRAQYEVDKASRHYHTVDPENRLVARELERRWEEKLIQQRKIKEDYERYESKSKAAFTEADRKSIRDLSANIPALWNDPGTSPQDRQQIVRILLKQVIARTEAGTEKLSVTLRWMGDVFTQHDIRRPVARYDQLKDYPLLLERIITLYDQGQTTSAIAAQLNKEGWHPPKHSAQFNQGIVAALLSREDPGYEATSEFDADGYRRHLKCDESRFRSGDNWFQIQAFERDCLQSISYERELHRQKVACTQA
ncbi:MAG TPA: recombinase family protein [Oligoflexus sp.]|nr:recombinase family protein [Oligoflexus sp.]HYX32196.1 recombinase family protein [Oligoflexus sp.]